MAAYYNEFNPLMASWLRDLIAAGLIAPGEVDERSITEVHPDDLNGFTQCHFFAGLGGWSYALRLAGVPDDFPCWTGSPPCQPFSVAGNQQGLADARHLAPVFLRLICERHPPVLFGEQVAAAITKNWLDDLCTHLEDENYACGSAVLPACSIGAPHKRERLFFGACSLADTDRQRLQRIRPDHHPQGRQKPDVRPAGLCSGAGDNRVDPLYGHWEGAHWVGCADGKWRPVESGLEPLADGIPGRVVQLQGYGNAIVPQLAAEFITAFTEALC